MVQILDSTLREGEQTPGVCFPTHAKLAIARALDGIGIDIIEAGHPVVGRGVEEAIRRIARSGCKAQIAAHARTVLSDVDLALDCGIGFLGIFYCVSNDRLDGVFKNDLASAIDQITDVISYAKSKSPNLTIRYTPEDTVRSKWDNVVVAAAAAVEAGADIISIADTTGIMVPHHNSLYKYVHELRDALSKRNCNPKIAVHCHNDRGLAVSNALSAYQAGVDIIDTTVLGLGERAGIVDMAQLLVVLSNDFGLDQWNLSKLPEFYELVSRYSGVPIPPTYPVMGANAFTHCAGVHTHAATKNAVHYQSLNPGIVGREMQVALDHMSGRSSVQYALEQIGEQIDDSAILDRILEQVKRVGETNRHITGEELHDIVAWCHS
jgi:2-isopropylmalate synthase